ILQQKKGNEQHRKNADEGFPYVTKKDIDETRNDFAVKILDIRSALNGFNQLKMVNPQVITGLDIQFVQIAFNLFKIYLRNVFSLLNDYGHEDAQQQTEQPY